MSASEKLRALEEQLPEWQPLAGSDDVLVLVDALPQIRALVEAAEVLVRQRDQELTGAAHGVPERGEGALSDLALALSALDEALP